MRASRRASAIRERRRPVLKRWPLVPPLYRMRRYSEDPWRASGWRLLDGLGVRWRRTHRGLPHAGGRATTPGVHQLHVGGRPAAPKGRQPHHRDPDGATPTRLRPATCRSSRADVDMTCFPAVVLQQPGPGGATHAAAAARPAPPEPPSSRRWCSRRMRRFGVTTMSGPRPAYLTRVARHIRRRRRRAGPPPCAASWPAARPVPRRLCELLVKGVSRAPRCSCLRVHRGRADRARARPRRCATHTGEGPARGARPVQEVELEVVTLPDRIEREVGPPARSPPRGTARWARWLVRRAAT